MHLDKISREAFEERTKMFDDIIMEQDKEFPYLKSYIPPDKDKEEKNKNFKFKKKIREDLTTENFLPYVKVRFDELIDNEIKPYERYKSADFTKNMSFMKNLINDELINNKEESKFYNTYMGLKGNIRKKELETVKSYRERIEKRTMKKMKISKNKYWKFNKKGPEYYHFCKQILKEKKSFFHKKALENVKKGHTKKLKNFNRRMNKNRKYDEINEESSSSEEDEEEFFNNLDPSRNFKKYNSNRRNGAHGELSLKFLGLQPKTDQFNDMVQSKISSDVKAVFEQRESIGIRVPEARRSGVLVGFNSKIGLPRLAYIGGIGSSIFSDIDVFKVGKKLKK